MNKNCKYSELCEKENARLGELWAYNCQVPKGKKGFEKCTRYEDWERDDAIRISEGTTEEHTG